jgi:uncharacterized protein (TIGR01319 family)
VAGPTGRRHEGGPTLSAELALLYDLGSTFTKVAAVDLATGALVAWAKAPSSVATDVTEGLETALGEAEALGGFDRRQAVWRLASSSAAGGLRLVAVGLVPELTGEAARRAALGAGAKVVRTFSYELTSGEVRDLDEARPDIILLAGGTDGGNKSVILQNASSLASARTDAPIVVAGNKVVAEEVARVLQAAGKQTWVTENVLPSVGVLNVDPARQAIREVFIRRIVHAKGFDRALRYVEGVLMPTPTAVLTAAQLLAQAASPARPRDREAGVPAVTPAGWPGGVVVVDVGGATTDVHSIGKGEPTQPGLIPKGLPEPVAKRTVEGDLGVRWNATSILEAVGVEAIQALMEKVVPGAVAATPGADVARAVTSLHEETWRVPAASWEIALDYALAASAVDLAVSRHAGQIEEVYTPSGKVSVLYGKDLTEFGLLVGTGGPIVSNRLRTAIVRAALSSERQPLALKPRRPRTVIDKHYVLYAVGLLAERDRAAAWRLARASLIDLQGEPS